MLTEPSVLGGSALRCFLFTAAVFICALVAERIFSDSIFAVTVVAVLSVCAALWISTRRRWFEKEIVDRMYYSVATIGVVLLFAHQEPERKKIEALSQIQYARLGVDAAEGKLADFDTAIRRERQLLAEIEANPTDFLNNLKRIEAMARNKLSEHEAQACAEASGFGLHSSWDVQDRLRETQDRAAAQQLCKVAQVELEKRRSAMESLSLDFPTIEKNPDRFADLTDRSLVVGGVSISPAEAVAILTHQRDSKSVEFERSKLLAALTTAKNNLKEVDATYLQAVDKAERARSHIIGKLALSFWPYVLIVLLSLKLGRAREAYENQ